MRHIIAIVTVIVIVAASAAAAPAPRRVIPFEDTFAPWANIIPRQEVGPRADLLDKDKKTTAKKEVSKKTAKKEVAKKKVTKASLLASCFAEAGASYGKTFATFGRSLLKNLQGE